MKLSKPTIAILKNYAAINPNILFTEGTTLKTVDELGRIMSQATIEDSIETEFGIYDLNEFLSTLSLFAEVNLEVNEKGDSQYVSITSESQSSSAKYGCADKDILTVPTKSVKMPEADITFTLRADLFNNLKKAASTMGFQELTILKDGDSISINAADVSGTTSNNYSAKLEGVETTLDKFYVEIPFEILKLFPGDYEVEISKGGVSHFKSTSVDIEYWIALNKTSTFN